MSGRKQRKEMMSLRFLLEHHIGAGVDISSGISSQTPRSTNAAHCASLTSTLRRMAS